MPIHLSKTFRANAKTGAKIGLATVALGGGALAGAATVCGVCDGLFGILTGDRLTEFFNPLVQKAELLLKAGVPAAVAGTILYRLEKNSEPAARP